MTTTNTTSKSRQSGAKANASADKMSGTTAMLGAAAAGVAIGVAAMIGRKVAVQAPTMLAGDWDVALAAEHSAVSKLFNAMEQTTSDNSVKRTMLLAQIKHALAKHALQEENTIYPALRDSGQAEAADSLNHDHGYVKQYLYELENMPKNGDAFLATVQRFRADLDKHIREEEEKLFPILKAQHSVEANKKLTAAMNKEGFKLA